MYTVGIQVHVNTSCLLNTVFTRLTIYSNTNALHYIQRCDLFSLACYRGLARDAVSRSDLLSLSCVYVFGGDSGKKFKRFTLVSIRGSCLSNAVSNGYKSFTLQVTTKKVSKIGSMVK